MQSNDCGVLNFSAGMVLHPQHFQQMQSMQATARHMIQADYADHPLLERLVCEVQGDTLCIAKLQVIWQGWVYALVSETRSITLPQAAGYSKSMRLDARLEDCSWHQGTMDGQFFDKPDWNDGEHITELQMLWPRWKLCWRAVDDPTDQSLPLLLFHKDEQEKSGWKIAGGFPEYMLHSHSAGWSMNFCRQLTALLAEIPGERFGDFSVNIQSEILWLDASQKQLKWTELWRDFRKLLKVLQMPSLHESAAVSLIALDCSYWLGEFRALCGIQNIKKITLKAESSVGGQRRWVCVLPPRLLSGDVSAMYLHIAFSGAESGQFVIASGKDMDTVLRYGLQGVSYRKIKAGKYEIQREGEYWLALQQSRELAISISGDPLLLADPLLSWEG